MLRALITLSLCLSMSACASRTKGIDKIQPGMDKDQVLDAAGDPKRTYRMNGQDNWVYIYYDGHQEVQNHVAFEDGVVVRIAKPTSKNALNRELEAKGSIEEYERKNKPKRPTNNSGFKTIDGGPEDVNKP